MKFQPVAGGICAAKGFKAGGIHAGIRNNSDKKDLAWILSEKKCSAAAVYTQNKVKGAPLLLTQKNLQNGYAQAILCNSGNANTCNSDGMEVAEKCCEMAAKAAGVAFEDIVITSTGVIGQPLLLAPFESGIPQLVKIASVAGGPDAAQAIMTTDTVRKEFSISFSLGEKVCHLGAIGKGSGMINPNMATMLIFITTDVDISPAMLDKAVKQEVKQSLNQICIDGDTSTNDMAVVLANGLAGNAPVETQDENYNIFCEALHQICVQMCRAIAADGEGATKLLECTVKNAKSPEIALNIAKTIIASDLLKAAMFGADANWGRVLCAIGYTPGDFSVEDVSLVLKSKAGQVHVCEHAMYNPYSEEKASRVLAEDEIEILVDMHDGTQSGMAWGCDLTYDYVKINGDYRT